MLFIGYIQKTEYINVPVELKTILDIDLLHCIDIGVNEDINLFALLRHS